MLVPIMLSEAVCKNFRDNISSFFGLLPNFVWLIIGIYLLIHLIVTGIKILFIKK